MIRQSVCGFDEEIMREFYHWRTLGRKTGIHRC
jgi:hypothetical protein